MFPARLLGWFRLTMPEYFADFLITPPITAVMLYLSARHGVTLDWLGEFVCGLLAWTIYEYATHRWLLHRTFFFRDLHALHHDDQRDYIALHPAATIATYATLWLTFGTHSTATASGFSVGYVIYSALHTAFHYARIGSRNPLFLLKRHHALHHAFDDVNFGVSTTLWDRVFGTKR